MEDKGLTAKRGAGLGRLIATAGAIAMLCLGLAVAAGSTSPPHSGFLYEWGETGSGPGEFSFPVSVAATGSGTVYVADSSGDRIQYFDLDGALLGQWGGTGTGPGQFATPEAVEVDNFGNVYVADKGNYRIQKFTGDGTWVGQWGSAGSGPGQFEAPEGLATDHEGNVYVADAGNDRIQKFTSSGAFVTQWGGAGKGAGQLSSPSGVAVGQEGSVFVADTGNDRIQKFTTSGAFLAKWGKTGEDPGELDSPLALAGDAAGRVYVADTGNDRIQVFDDGGGFIDEWGVHGRAPGQLDTPLGVSPLAGRIFVADAGNDRIQVFGQLAKPQFGKSFNVGVVSGFVSVRLPGSTGFTALGADQQLPVGTVLDTSRGRVRLTSATGPSGGTQSADFYSGVFKVLQPKGGKPVTVLKLQGPLACGKSNRLATASKKKARGLWGSGKGNFRSEGRHGSATVRGTIWWAQDTCDGTLFKVKKGVVTIKDFTSGKSLKLTAGQKYLAPSE